MNRSVSLPIRGSLEALTVDPAPSDRSPVIIPPILCGGMILLGFLLMLRGWEAIERAYVTSTWPTTPGVIVSAELSSFASSEAGRGRPLITYTYSVNGKVFTNTRVSLGTSSYSLNESAAWSMVRRYRPRTPVTVHYRPDRPNEAVLEHTVPSTAYLSLAIGAALALPGSGLVLLMTLARWRQRRAPYGPEYN